jgi:tetratricopeptide (TPR) repeat protein
MLALLAACAQTPGPNKSTTPGSAAPAGETPAETAVATPPPTPAPAPVVVLSAQEIQRTIGIAVEYLEAGQEEPAEAELKKVLQSDPNQRLALSLMRQIKEDPVSILGAQSFPYKVQPGESLSKIAQRFINNDPYSFYALARYNKIAVPRSLGGGQIIRVPGKAPPTTAIKDPPPVPPPVTVTKEPPPAPPPPPPAPAGAGPVDQMQAQIFAQRKREEDIQRYTKAARAAMAKQDLDGAIRNWDAVLKIDPDNTTAPLERQRAVTLREKLGKVK